MWTFKYTHVEENSCMGNVESLVSTNSVVEVGVELKTSQNFGNAVVDMYAKCGSLEKAKEVRRRWISSRRCNFWR